MAREVMASHRVRALGAWTLLLALVATTGCLGFRAAHVPSELLGGPSGNGWRENATLSEPRASEEALGTFAHQTFVYEDAGGDAGGYPALLTLFTMKGLFTPSRTELLERVEEKVQEWAERNGVQVLRQTASGERRLASADESVFVLFNATAVSERPFFTRDSELKVAGEVWTCRATDASVVAVGFAQVTDVQRLSPGVVTLTRPDATNWIELVEDPQGTIEGHRGTRGLIHQTRC